MSGLGTGSSGSRIGYQLRVLKLKLYVWDGGHILSNARVGPGKTSGPNSSLCLWGEPSLLAHGENYFYLHFSDRGNRLREG